MARYIDADKLLEKFREAQTNFAEKLTTINLLEAASTENVAPVKHAHWKDGCCTNCKTPKFLMKVTREFDEVIYEYEGKANYCPNCGARMEEEE